MSEFVEARIGVGAKEGDSEQRDQENPDNAKFRVSSFEFQVEALWRRLSRQPKS